MAAGPAKGEPVKSIRSVLALSIAGALVLGACGGDDDDSSGEVTASPTVNVGRTNDPISQLMAEIYGQGLENAGYRIGRKDPAADGDAALAAVKGGTTQLFPEFSADLLAFVKANGGAGSDAVSITDQMTAIRDQLPDTMTVFEPADVDNRTVIACSGAAIDEHSLTDVSSLTAADGVTVGATEAFQDATAGGLAALDTAYGVEMTVTTVDDVAAALADGSADCGALPALTPEIVLDGLIVLDDDKQFAPANKLVPVMTVEAGQADVQAVVDAINGKLTTDVIRSLLVKLQTGDQSYDTIAREFLGTTSSDQG
jgi:osmoprotectant transport system substrate-binding protein